MVVLEKKIIMEYNNFYGILLSFIPVYFYYVPYLLIKKFFLEFINKTFLTLGLEESAGKNQKLNLLEERVGRIVSFISFLSIWAATSLAVFFKHLAAFFKQSTYQLSNFNLFHIYIFLVFFILGLMIIYKNLASKDKFIVNRGFIIIETFVVFVSVILAVFIL